MVLVAPQVDCLAADVARGEELTREREVDRQRRLLEPQPVDETTGQDVEDPEALVQRAGEEPLAVRLRESEVRNVVVCDGLKSAHSLEPILRIPHFDTQVAERDRDEIVATIVEEILD